MFRDAIAEGAAQGIVQGWYKGLGVLTPAAAAYLVKSAGVRGYKADTPKERGIRAALVELGYLRWVWWRFKYVRTYKPVPLFSPVIREAVRKARKKAVEA